MKIMINSHHNSQLMGTSEILLIRTVVIMNLVSHTAEDIEDGLTSEISESDKTVVQDISVPSTSYAPSASEMSSTEPHNSPQHSNEVIRPSNPLSPKVEQPITPRVISK